MKFLTVVRDLLVVLDGLSTESVSGLVSRGGICTRMRMVRIAEAESMYGNAPF